MTLRFLGAGERTAESLIVLLTPLLITLLP